MKFIKLFSQKFWTYILEGLFVKHLFLVKHLQTSVSYQATNSLVLVHWKPSRLKKLLIYLTLSFCFFMSFDIFLTYCYCWLWFFVFCYIYLPAIYSQQDLCRFSTKNSVNLSTFGIFYCFLLNLNRSQLNWKSFFYNSFLLSIKVNFIYIR